MAYLAGELWLNTACSQSQIYNCLFVPLCSKGEFVAFAKCFGFLSSGTP